MATADLNLLITLDAVLTEGSVAGAARRLRLSPSAMSRALARLRAVTGDPLLVRAGRGLVPTPRALQLREQVSQLVQDAQVVLRPAERLDLQQLQRTFTLRCREGFVENFGADLLARVQAAAPGVRLCFLAKTDKESGALRDGSVDLETGVVGKLSGPELKTRALFRDRFVAVVRAAHPLCEMADAGSISAAAYAAGKHINVSRRALVAGPLDMALQALGLGREVGVIVASFASALALARGSDLIATVPERQTGVLREGLHSFALPFAAQESITVAMLWHPRQDADPAHRWLRAQVFACCAPSDDPVYAACP